MSMLTEIADRLRISPASARAMREAERDRNRTIARLESVAASKIRVMESLYDPSAFIDPRERYMDGDTFFAPPAGIAGGRNDRTGGQSFPVLWSETHLQALRGNARVLCDTNMFAIGMRDRHVDFVVGDGMKPEVTLKGQKNRPDDNPAVRNCQAVIDEWRAINSWGDGPWNADPCDPLDDTGLLQNREREGYERAVVDGEIGLRFFAGSESTNRLPVVRWIEPEFLGTPPGELMQGPYSWGIEVDPDDNEKRLNYYVYDTDARGAGITGEPIPAGKVVFAKLNTVSTVKRGITDFFPVGASLDRIRKLLDAMGEVAAILSQIAYLRQHAPGVTSTQATSMIGNLKDRDVPRSRGSWGGLTASAIPTVYQEPGTIHDVSSGMQYVPAPMQAGAASFIKVQQAILRGVGQRWGMPEFFSGDASNNNYASIAVTGSPFERAVKSRQSWYAMVQRAIYGKVLAYACRSGRLSEADVKAVEVKIVPTSASATDSYKEAQTNEILCRNKVLSPQTWASKAGLDADHEQNQIQAHDEAFPDAGGFGGMGFGGGGGGDFPEGPAGDPGDDPTGGEFDRAMGEAVLEESSFSGDRGGVKTGFSGTLTDSKGRKRTYVNGRQIARPVQKQASQPKQAAKASTDAKPAVVEPKAEPAAVAATTASEPAKAEPKAKAKKARAPKMTIKSLEKEADDLGRQSLAAAKAGDTEKARQFNAASYGMRRAAKYIEDGDKDKAAKSFELAGKLASGEVKLPKAKPATEAILEGFTGTVTGADGHEYHYQDGKRVGGASGQADTPQFVPHERAQASPGKYATIEVDTAKLNDAWAKDDPSFHIPAGGGGAEIGGRREGFQRFLQTGKPVQASLAYLSKDGKLSFEDGRHRFSVLRDNGLSTVAISVPKEQADEFRKRFGKTGSKPATEAVEEGFTGTITGTDGHQYHYQDGKRVGRDTDKVPSMPGHFFDGEQGKYVPMHKRDAAQHDLSKLSQGEAESLKVGDLVKFKGSEWAVKAIKTQKRVLAVGHPLEAGSIESIEVPYKITSVTLHNTSMQSTKPISFSGEKEAKAEADRQWAEKLGGKQ